MRKNGFTLLEVLLATLLVVGGFIFLLQAMAVGLFAGGDNEGQLIALNLSQEKLEELRNKSYASVINETEAAVTGFPSFEREVIVTVPQIGLKEVNVSTSWRTKASTLSVNLVTYLSNT